MKALLILGVVALILILIGLIPLGVDAAWRENDLTVALRIWLFRLRLGGRKEKKPKENGTAEASADQPKKEKKRPSRPLIRILAENGCRTLFRLVSRHRTDLLRVHFTSAFPDPAATALAYGAAGAVMEGILNAGGARIRHRDLRADVDFQRSEPEIDARICVTVRVYQILGEALRFGYGFLRDYIRNKREDS